MTTRKSKTTKTETKTKKATPAPTKKLSQIDAAVQVLDTSKEPMNCKALVEAMTKQGLLYSLKSLTSWS